MVRLAMVALMISAGVSAMPSALAPIRGPAIQEASNQSVLLRYPPQQQREGIGGTSVVQVTVDASGAARAISIRLSSGNGGLDRAAIRHAERLRFEPALRAGLPVEGIILVPVNFTPLHPAVADGTPARKMPPKLRPGFECASASEEFEQSLCDQAGLGASELKLRDVYGRAVAGSADAGVRSLVIDGHRTWLADRNRRCGADPDCLAKDSRDRARYIRLLAGFGP
jgi:TonB family protein